jgi:hypothetical protein
MPTGKTFETRQGVKFKAWAERAGLVCTIRVERAEDADRLRSYLQAELPQLQIVEATRVETGPGFRLTVTCDSETPPWKLHRALIDCPLIFLRQVFSVAIKERPHYRIQAYNLAAWIDDQGERTWWSVDGDPLLMSRVDFPCPPDELSSELRGINKPLLVADPSDEGSGEEITPEEVGRVVDTNPGGWRYLYLSWEGSETDWLLLEDEPLGEEKDY